MNEPTEEQIKELLDWCELEVIDAGNMAALVIIDGQAEVLPIDLNNLFKWAVPKLGSWTDIEFRMREDGCTCVLKQGHQPVRHGRDKDPALALLWAIYSKIKGGNNENQSR